MSRRALRRQPLGAVLVTVAALLAGGCTSLLGAGAVSSEPTTSGQPLVSTVLVVGPGLDASPLDEPRRVLAPGAWTVSVWARVPSARLAAWAPDRKLLVSRPKEGDVVALTPGSGSSPPRASRQV